MNLFKRTSPGPILPSSVLGSVERGGVDLTPGFFASLSGPALAPKLFFTSPPAGRAAPVRSRGALGLSPKLLRGPAEVGLSPKLLRGPAEVGLSPKLFRGPAEVGLSPKLFRGPAEVGLSPKLLRGPAELERGALGLSP